MSQAGRPSKYKPEYCQMLVDHMKQGFSFESFGAKIGVCKDTLFEWEKVHPAFSDHKKIGFTMSQYFHEKALIDGMMGEIRNFNAAAAIFAMKNRFKWTDRQTIQTDEEKPIEIAFNPKGLTKKA